MIFRLAGLPSGIAVMDVLADIDAVYDKVAFNDDFTLNIRRLTAAVITGRQICSISLPAYLMRRNIDRYQNAIHQRCL